MLTRRHVRTLVVIIMIRYIAWFARRQIPSRKKKTRNMFVPVPMRSRTMMMTQRTAAKQRQNDFSPLLARGIVVTPAKAGVYCVLLDFESGWNTMDTGRVSPTKIFNFCRARCRYDEGFCRARLGGGRFCAPNKCL